MQTLSARVQTRMQTAASVLTPRLRQHAAKRGVNAGLIRQLHVEYDHDGGFQVGVKDSEYQRQFDDEEWGSLDNRPAAFVRTFKPHLDSAYKHALHEALLEHLSSR